MRGYTAEQMEWLASNAKSSTWAELATAYNKRYGTAHSTNRLKTHCNRHGIYATEPLGSKAVWNEKPIGHICPTSKGYSRIKTADGYKMLARQNMPTDNPDIVCCYLDGGIEYHTRKAMRLYALQCRYNKGFPANRKTAMAVCELDVARKEKV